jgi:hypothetical protein
LQAFTWRDVDLEAGTFSVSKAIDGRTGKPKPLPKTESAVRDVPIDPSLARLLQRMYDEADDDDAPVLPLLLKWSTVSSASACTETLGFGTPALTARPRYQGLLASRTNDGLSAIVCPSVFCARSQFAKQPLVCKLLFEAAAGSSCQTEPTAWITKAASDGKPPTRST